MFSNVGKHKTGIMAWRCNQCSEQPHWKNGPDGGKYNGQHKEQCSCCSAKPNQKCVLKGGGKWHPSFILTKAVGPPSRQTAAGKAATDRNKAAAEKKVLAEIAKAEKDAQELKQFRAQAAKAVKSGKDSSPSGPTLPHADATDPDAVEAIEATGKALEKQIKNLETSLVAHDEDDPDRPALLQMVATKRARLAENRKQKFELKSPGEQLLAAQAAQKKAKDESAKAKESFDAAVVAYDQAANKCDEAAATLANKRAWETKCDTRYDEAVRTNLAVPPPRR